MEQKPVQNNNSQGDEKFVRLMIISAVCIPVIGGLLFFAYTKHGQSGVLSRQCQESCTQQGYPGYDFQWGVFSASNCRCIGNK